MFSWSSNMLGLNTVTWGRILGRNPDKSIKSFTPCYSESHLGFALRFLFLQTRATSYSFCRAFLYIVKEKGGKPDRKPYPFLYGLKNPYRNLKSENSLDYAGLGWVHMRSEGRSFFCQYTHHMHALNPKRILNTQKLYTKISWSYL